MTPTTMQVFPFPPNQAVRQQEIITPENFSFQQLAVDQGVSEVSKQMMLWNVV